MVLSIYIQYQVSYIIYIYIYILSHIIYIYIFIYIIFIDDKNTSECEHTQFCDPHHKHIPGNLVVIGNSELQN